MISWYSKFKHEFLQAQVLAKTLLTSLEKGQNLTLIIQLKKWSSSEKYRLGQYLRIST